MGLCCPCRGIQEANDKSHEQSPEAGTGVGAKAAATMPVLQEFAQELPSASPVPGHSDEVCSLPGSLLKRSCLNQRISPMPMSLGPMFKP